MPGAAKGPAFAVAVGLLLYPQAAHLEHFEPRKARQQVAGPAAMSPEPDDGFARASDDPIQTSHPPMADRHDPAAPGSAALT
jgi:hypothetical protein